MWVLAREGSRRFVELRRLVMAHTQSAEDYFAKLSKDLCKGFLPFAMRMISRMALIATICRFCACVIVLVSCLGVASCDRMDPVSQEKLNEIKTIWSTIPLYPGMIEVNHSASSGFRRAFMSRSFCSEASYNDIKRFYSDHLLRAGWQLVTERPLKDWEKDLGGQLLEFHKGEYHLSIQYSGQKADYGWQYGIAVRWPTPK